MNNNEQLLTRELVDLKYKVMIQKMDKLYSICNMIFGNSKTGECNFLEAIKKQYNQRYKKIIETEQYEKYKKVEDIVFKEIAKIEFKIDSFVYDTSKNYAELIKRNIDNIYNSKNYQNFINLDEEIQKIKTLKEILVLYKPYTSSYKIEEIEKKILKVRFDLLYRKQVEQMIYENGGKSNNLLNYENLKEREFFLFQLERKIKTLVKIISNYPLSEKKNLRMMMF